MALNNRIAELHRENQTRTNERDLARTDLASTAQESETVDSLKIRLRTDHNLDRKAVEEELVPFGKLTAADSG